MSKVTDAILITETALGRTVDNAHLFRIADAFVAQDPYSQGGWFDITFRVSTATPTLGGTGYAVDDILTVVGGTGTVATLKVTSEAAGVIDGLSIETFGDYTIFPTSPVTLTGGLGDQTATATLTSSQTDTPRLPTNEEKAELYIGNFLAWGRTIMRADAEYNKKETELPNFYASITAEGDIAEGDMT